MPVSVSSSDIRIDKEGIWYYRGAEMFRQDIVNLLYRSLKQDEEGRYLIDFAGEHAYLEVEDTPFVIKSVSYTTGAQGEEAFHLSMPDGSEESLDPKTLRINADDVLYCTLGPGFPARFSRAAYYQLAEHIQYDAEQDSHYLLLNGHRFYITITTENSTHS